ncbi:flagellar hook-length control protein FliK [Marinobacter sp. BGYM27]|uniref:flagellar hook-length control protein FliK n=1 Tax=Marinobacter sp. BGYM27 TaxID=2975597 RepID=UPI0021A3220A|nr:flagellar hook-length control protein FliK [Marinobacter sp. BGYM27]MDG5498595.1 flagellar hook-length control protein FliK [Marinobacter sp. BGYM27]
MSGILLTPASLKPEQNLDRPRQDLASDQASEGFDAVSAREKQRLEDRATESRRADQRAQDARIEDQRLADRRAARDDQRDAIADKRADAKTKGASDSNARDEARPAAESRQPEDTSRQESAETRAEKEDTEATEAQGQAVAEGDQEKPESPDDETVVPLFMNSPTQLTNGQTGKIATGTTPTGSAAMAPMAAGTNQQSPVAMALKAGKGGGEGLPSESGETLKGLLGKSTAAGEGKGIEFSAQLNRLQGGAESASKSGPASLQQAQGAKEVLAPLKSYSTSIDLPVQHAEWGEKVAGKLAWLTTQRMSVAEIHITPPDFGPMEVRVHVHNDQANVAIHASHSVVRDQLELNGHRLRDMLQDSGLTLERFEVSADASGQGQRDSAGEGTGTHGEGVVGNGDMAELDQDDGAALSGSLDLSWRGEVDLYA